MNLLLILIFISVTFFKDITKAFKNEICENINTRTIRAIPNEIFNDIEINTSLDLILNMTQIDIIAKPTKNFYNKSSIVTISSNITSCTYHEQFEFNLIDGNIITIPPSTIKTPKNELKPGCNYTLTFSVGNNCFIKFYEIPEPKPCPFYSSENTFTSFPNRVIRSMSINAYKTNFPRLNISLVPNSEFVNETGLIVLNSKMSRCNHPEEFGFTLNENDVIVPKAEFPHSFIDSGCEYMIDFEIDQYCISVNYKVPDFCAGKQSKIKIQEVVGINSNTFKVIWVPKVDQQLNYTKIGSIYYRIENDFKMENVLQTEMNENFFVLDLSHLPKGQTYNLIATVVDEENCSYVISKEFYIPADYSFVWKYSLILFSIIILTIVVCVFYPTAKTVLIFKYLFGTMGKIQTPEPSEGNLLKRTVRKEEINLDYTPLELETCDEFEIPKNRLIIDRNETPRSGNFGVVHLGKVYGLDKCKHFTPVAIKTLRENAPYEEEEALNDEIKTLKKISSQGNHENIVKMFGCCTIQKPKMIILEFVACGDLKNYLLGLRNEWTRKKTCNAFIFPSDGSHVLYVPSKRSNRTTSETSSNCLPSPTETDSTILYDDTEDSLLNTPITRIETALSSTQLQNFALQIAKGMAFLEKISVVHRDLAARNVLINEMKILKISDFGMSRIGDYTHRNNGQQPLRWMALESIEKCVCTSKSDVWSFGVVLWEIGTLGAFPYDNISNECILGYLLYNLKKGIRLMRPEICTDELYSLMLKCWSENQNERPSFQQIVQHLSGEEKKIYLDFRKLNPAYVFPPTKS